ncbi:LacI family DNA-binding transcriptional regulator [Pseudoflavonifractor phocaeensis]|uniref:LacI family DNA-binding transcriptional regulator n=1 Tax=Pseudoflavonifractor phocaeensis TaxID=1870988 RepID=UPI001956E56D|nr:LacI family DNA-binding transcriptional regulator [Pseudoflavonifractor phocaeensis]MBM6926970.1 LacI family DNA-binding transcriptional regulator [Pseudoflavonifractor phocaeensis]
MKKKVTIYDVAAEANVSIATVSRVMNQPDSVKEMTTKRVLQAMKTVGYESTNENFLFRVPLIKSAKRLILVVIPNLGNPFYANIVAGIHASALRQDIQYVICQSRNQHLRMESLLDLVSDTHSSGLLLLTPPCDKDTIEKISTVVPTVQCTEHVEGANVSSVSVDNFSAGKAVVQYMLSRGKSRIALLNGPLRFQYARMRLNGYLAALEEAGIPADNSLIANLPEIDYESAYSVMTQLLNSGEPPDSCFAVSDVLGAAAIKAANRANLPVPEKFGVVGFDNTFISTISDPSLTTVNQPCYRMGFLACEMLAEHMNDPHAEVKQIVLETEIIIRDSI